MNGRPALLLIQAEPIGVDGRTRWINEKTLAGVRLYARDWPGPIVVSAPTYSGKGDAMTTPVDEADLEFELMTDRLPVAAAREVKPAVVLALHSPANYALIGFEPHRTVFTLENSLAQRFRVGLMQSPSAASGLRTALGLARRAPAFYRVLRRAGGIQCNGYAVWNAYHRISRSPMLFFDHRVSGKVLGASSPVQPAPSGPLRLGFSGRHIAIKGPQYAVELCSRLRKNGVNANLRMYGDGVLRGALEQEAGDGIHFAGAIPFEEQWIPSVRRDVDLMVLPYPQADPAGTYLESFALGVPVLGFKNAAFEPLVRHHGVGWSAPVGDVGALADIAEYLAEHPELLTEAGERALAFMSSHGSEDEFAARVRHLRDIAQV